MMNDNSVPLTIEAYASSGRTMESRLTIQRIASQLEGNVLPLSPETRTKLLALFTQLLEHIEHDAMLFGMNDGYQQYLKTPDAEEALFFAFGSKEQERLAEITRNEAYASLLQEFEGLLEGSKVQCLSVLLARDSCLALAGRDAYLYGKRLVYQFVHGEGYLTFLANCREHGFSKEMVKFQLAKPKR